jgi:hypothetical protein
MTGNAMNPISRITERALRWSSTSNAVACPESRSGSFMTLQVSPQQCVIAPLSTPVARSSGLNHNVIAHKRRLLDRSATIKSP